MKTLTMKTMSWLGLVGACCWLACHRPPALQEAERYAQERRWQEAWPRFERAVAEASDVRERARAGLRFAVARQEAGQWPASVDLLQDALTDLSSQDETLRAEILLRLAHAKLSLGETARARELAADVLELGNRLGSDRFRGLAHHRLGSISSRQGDWETAERHGRSALQALERVDPNSLELGWVCHNLAHLAWRRGEFPRADRLYARAAELKERHAPGSLTLARTLGLWGNLLQEMGDFERARSLYERALAISEADGQIPSRAAHAWSMVAQLDLNQGDLDHAEGALERAENRLRGSGTPLPALSFYRGILAERRGRLATAESEFRSVVDHYLRAAPNHADVIEARLSLGRVLLAQDRPEEALQQLTSAAEKASMSNHGPDQKAWLAHGFGQIWEHLGEPHRALGNYLDALSLVEQQVDMLDPGLHGRGRFRDRRRQLYWDPVRLSVELGLWKQAWNLQEQARAAELRSMFQPRNPGPRPEAPQALVEEKHLLDESLHGLQHRMVLARFSGEAIDGLDERARSLRRERDHLAARIRRLTVEADRLGAQAGSAVDLDQLRQSLEPGTVALAYFLGEDSSWLGILGADVLEWQRLSITGVELERQVERFRREIELHRRTDIPGYGRLQALAKQLFQDLLEPAWPVLEEAQRLLIFPDGPLHLLPFPALIRERDDEPSFLVELKTTRVTLSGSLHRLLVDRADPGRRLAKILAFGDPYFPEKLPQAAAAPAVVGHHLRDFELGPIPGSRRELKAIGELFGKDVSMLTGTEATEQSVKQLEPGVDVLHFATHGFFHPRLGLDSALLLALPETYRNGEQNGILEAWEVFEEVRLDAGLVVLSACSTARGRLAGSEGVIGLTRAFQFAGADRVIASLWNVSDPSTATLMKSFYGELKAGRRVDEALREAQLATLAQPSTRAPFFWAAFVLDGVGR